MEVLLELAPRRHALPRWTMPLPAYLRPPLVWAPVKVKNLAIDGRQSSPTRNNLRRRCPTSGLVGASLDLAQIDHRRGVSVAGVLR
jgi:hypothetical protein